MSSDTTQRSTAACILTVLTWAALLVCVSSWMTYAAIDAGELADAMYITGISAGSVFLLFFISQITG